MKNIIFTIIIALVSNLSYAQVFEWAKSAGGNNPDGGNSLTLDALGNVYTTGFFEGTVDFDPSPNVFNLTSIGSAAFILKLDAAGNFVWAKKIGNPTFGSGEAEGLDIELDNNGYVYCMGSLTGTVDFNPNNATYNLTSSGEHDVFVLKLDTAGNFVWAKKMGGASDDYPSALAIDAAGNIYTTGYFSLTADFDPNAGIFNLISTYYIDIFISKLDAAGNFVWAKGMGSVDGDAGYALLLDNIGNVYITGKFNGTVDFDPNIGTFNLTSNGVNDIFITKLDVAGNFLWTKQIGGIGNDLGMSMAIDSNGDIFVSGYFTGMVDFDPGLGVFTLNTGNNHGMFFLKLDGMGNFVMAKQLVNFSSYYLGAFISLDASGNIYALGCFMGTVDFDPNAGVFNLTSVGNLDVFIAKYDNSGNFIWAKRMGGGGDDLGSALFVDNTGDVYSTGYFRITADFDPSMNTFSLSSLGDFDIFMQKMSQCTISSTQNQSACNSYTLNGQTYTAAGTYTQNLQSSSGCDSVITLNLTLNNSLDSLQVTACKFYVFNNDTYITSGIYPYHFTNIWGCDSSIVLDLTIINTVNTAVSQNGATLTSNGVNVNYQWLDCSTNSPILGATNQVFTPTVNGNYAVIVSANNCSDTSACYLVTSLGVAKNTLKSQMQVYPNPTTGVLNIDLGAEYAWAEVKVSSAIGQELMREKYAHSQLLSLQMPETEGVYFVEISLLTGDKLSLKIVVIH